MFSFLPTCKEHGSAAMTQWPVPSTYSTLGSMAERERASRMWIPKVAAATTELLFLPLLAPASAVAGAAGIVSYLTGPSDLKSVAEGDRTCASLALGSCIAVAIGPIFESLLPALEQLLERREHDALTEEHITMWRTPEGMLSTDVVPEGGFDGCKAGV